MDLDAIRNMPDDELKKFIGKLSQTKGSMCVKCNQVCFKDNKKTIYIGDYNPHNGQRMKKLCALCNDCYSDLLDYLAVSDVNWEE